VVFDARVVNPATWTSAGRSVIHGGIGAEDVNRGFLGVETGPLDSEACIRLTRVVPGSPADRAGLKAGDRVTKIDGMAVYQLPPAGRPSERSYSPGSTEPYIGSYIGALSPGTQVSVEVRRGRETVTIVAELSASFASLLTLLQTQSFDAERLAVLKAAGLDRRYSAEELTKICGTFDFDDGRLKVIEQTLPLLQDPKNAYRILSALDSSASKSKVSGWIGERAKSSTPSRDE